MKYERVAFMMIGLPGTGKSYFLENNLSYEDKERSIILSTDKYLIDRAIEEGKTYADIFGIPEEMTAAQSFLDKNLAHAIAAGKDIFWDQTNLTRKSRVAKLKRLPDSYAKVALIFPTPDEETHKARLKARESHEVPWAVVEKMAATFNPVTIEEGFNGIIKIDSDGDLPLMPR